MGNLPKLTVVIGGAASGKSALAEGLILADSRARSYVATAQAWDDEMRAKIARHRDMRGAGWTTHEAPLDPGAVLAGLGADQVALLDCATMWLSNHMMAETDLDAAETALVTALDASKASVVIVTNEVGLSVVPDNALARRFQTAQGRLNQRLAARADLVVNVVAGLPQVLKGAMP